MAKGGWNGLSVPVASSLFSSVGIRVEDRKQAEGSYVAIHPDGREIRKPKVTECAQEVIKQWFELK